MAFLTYSCNLTLFSLLSPHPFLIVLGDLRQPLVNGGGSNARERKEVGKYLLERLCLVYRVASPSQCVRKYWSLHVLKKPSDEYMNMIKIEKRV